MEDTLRIGVRPRITKPKYSGHLCLQEAQLGSLERSAPAGISRHEADRKRTKQTYVDTFGVSLEAEMHCPITKSEERAD